MEKVRFVSGFSKLKREEKLDYLLSYLPDPAKSGSEIASYRHADPEVQKVHDEFSENTITNYFLPYGIAPNFLINNKFYLVPMVTEESSVVAAAARSAGFWSSKGGFKTEVKRFIKSGQVHFIWNGDPEKLKKAFPVLKVKLFKATEPFTAKMVNRGGGIRDIELLDKRHEIDGYFQISAGFDTRDSMGANFINSCLEEFSVVLREFVRSEDILEGESDLNIIMSILSNYTDDCLVTSRVSCSEDDLQVIAGDLHAAEFARKFYQAVHMADVDVYRAVTHNKGIFNGIDSVLVATGNDFRAVEAAGHAWAARDGRYRSLTSCTLEEGQFSLELTMPMSIGTVGGLTGLHPMARLSLEILGNPDAKILMGIVASAGLASNFAAVSSLITKGIQRGHMKMHLSNILNNFAASDEEKIKAVDYFRDKKVSFATVENFLKAIRKEE